MGAAEPAGGRPGSLSVDLVPGPTPVNLNRRDDGDNDYLTAWSFSSPRPGAHGGREEGRPATGHQMLRDAHQSTACCC